MVDQWVQFPGLLIDLQSLNFSNYHYMDEEVAALLTIRFCFLEACKDIWIFQALCKQTDARLKQLNKK